MATPSAPDWQKNPTRPRPGASGAMVAFSRTAGSALTTPRQFGPTIRMPRDRAAATSSRSSSWPASSRSPKPPETTTTPRTPLRPHCSMTSDTPAAGTAITARSTSSGTSSTLGYARTPPMCRASGWTGYTGPANPYAIRLANTTCPIFAGSVLAPITATEPGDSIRSIERDSEPAAPARRRPRPGLLRRRDREGEVRRRRSRTRTRAE